MPSACLFFPENASFSISTRRTARRAARDRLARSRRSTASLKSSAFPVIGISRDSVTSHARFAEKNNLPFILLSDPDLTAIQAYGVWKEKKLYGKTSMGVVRTTFVISPDGKIEKIMEKVKPDTNAGDILAYLRENP